MYKKYFENNGLPVILALVTVLLFVYILLFEFILPINHILPKPSVLLDSIPSLFVEYQFVSSLLYSVSIIYSVMILSYFIMKLSSTFIIKYALLFPELKELFNYTNYFIPLFLTFIFYFWFGNSFFGEFLFVLVLVIGLIKMTIVKSSFLVKEEYVDSAKSLGLTGNEIISEVYWKSIQPEVFKTLLKQHKYILLFTILYEFICNTDGIGFLFSLSIKYNDLSILILLIALVILLIVSVEFVLKKLERKYFFWSM